MAARRIQVVKHLPYMEKLHLEGVFSWAKKQVAQQGGRKEWDGRVTCTSLPS